MADANVYAWPTVLDEVCRWLSKGKTIRDYCRQPGKPQKDALYDAIDAAGEEYERRIVRARARGCEDLAEEVLDIADDSSGDKLTVVDANGNEQERCDTEFVQRSKLRVEARMRLLAKWNSGRYGDRQQVEHDGLDALGEVLDGGGEVVRIAEEEDAVEVVDGDARDLPGILAVVAKFHVMTLCEQVDEPEPGIVPGSQMFGAGIAQADDEAKRSHKLCSSFRRKPESSSCPCPWCKSWIPCQRTSMYCTG